MATPRTLVRSLQTLRHPSFRSISQLSQSTLSTRSRIKFNSPLIHRSRAVAPLLRQFSTSPSHQHGHIHKPKEGEELYITFIDKDEKEHKIAVAEGDNLLDIAQAHDLEMEGACGGSCACSTCHVIVLDEDFYEKMAEPEDDENDMLDLAFGLTETSRLGCQITMTKELDGLRVKLPSMTRNLQASDFGSK
ncbi:ferredoxin [Annulohypoxylon maeteangense]|uniref:ferredoxin n=1 Tax=Annulohypoxylon maeteangense TaxID=1927788 RepID=UPI0020074B02|nr:ferredoxin [Annulohypoxylon maeteangense]KAI0883089.1 ferredoxin [Annulohypoxylon maeteangense]